MITAQVTKHANESTANLMRRFTRRIRSAGFVNKLRRERYFTRQKSENVNKVAKLRKIARTEEYQKLYKLGKIESHGR